MGTYPVRVRGHCGIHKTLEQRLILLNSVRVSLMVLQSLAMLGKSDAFQYGTKCTV